MSELTASDIAEKCCWYRAKKPRRCIDGTYNDRWVLWVNEMRTSVQYDGPTVGLGRRYPTTTMEKFLKWADRRITADEHYGDDRLTPPHR
jgi:hypothetical protein